jgi:hypothetical protein
MSPGELKGWLKQQPFLPKRLRMSNDATFDVFSPDWIMVGFSTAVIGMRRDPSSEIYDEPVLINLSQIVSVEPLEKSSTS